MKNKSKLVLSFIVAFTVYFLYATWFPSQQKELSQEVETNRDTPVVVPFQLTPSNNILIKTKLNGTNDLDLMFHTGNSNVCLTKTATKTIENLIFDQQADVKSWGGASSTRFSSGNSIQIGNLECKDITVFEDEHSGHGTDGKFGPDMFGNKVIEIDFDQNQIVLHSGTPETAKSYMRFDCRMHRSSIFVTGDLNIGEEVIQNEFMIHSGFGGTVLLDDEFVQTNDIEKQLETISESQVTDSFGNVLKTRKVILPKLSFDSVSFSNVPIGFFEGAIGRQKMSVMGGEVLKRFNIILDLKNSHVYFKRNSLFNLEFPS